MIATKMNTFTKPHKFIVSIFVVTCNALEGIAAKGRDASDPHLATRKQLEPSQNSTEPRKSRCLRCLQFKVFEAASFAQR